MRLRITWPGDSVELSRRETKAIENCRYLTDSVPPECLNGVSSYYRSVIPEGDGAVDILSLCLHAIRCGGEVCVTREGRQLVNIQRLEF